MNGIDPYEADVIIPPGLLDVDGGLGGGEIKSAAAPSLIPLSLGALPLAATIIL